MRKALLAATVPLLVALAVSACGQKGELKPRTAGRSPAPIPYGRDRQPTIDALLTRSAQEAPERSGELHTKSEPRDDDPFDLPPKS